MDAQTLTVPREDIHWTNEYEGWIGIYQSRTPSEVVTLHFASNMPDTFDLTSNIDNRRDHEVTFLKGTLKRLVNGEWQDIGLTRASEVHADALDNDPFYNVAADIKIV